MKTKRQIIRIDEKLCDGCGLCIPACPEGALQIIDGVARLVREGYCDGLGACLGECPQGALTVEETEVDEYDETGVIEHLKANSPDRLGDHIKHLREHGMAPAGEGAAGPRVSSELRQWPIQLHLVNPIAPYFKDADLVLVADCVPFAYANFHNDFLKGKAVAIACPKLDDTGPYIAKLTRMIDIANLKSMKVVVMEVPCCSGLVGMAREAIKQAERSIPLEYVVIGVKGDAIG